MHYFHMETMTVNWSLLGSAFVQVQFFVTRFDVKMDWTSDTCGAIVSFKKIQFDPVRQSRVESIRVVATTPEKTHNQKFLTFETILNRFLVQF